MGHPDDLEPIEAHQRRDEVQLLDVREPHEWAAGHIEGALHVPMGQLAAGQDQLATDRTIVCVCRSGGRSAAVAEALRRAGYEAVNLLGGMHGWAADDLRYVS
jgi:rhodanese-related sulfurtransferase